MMLMIPGLLAGLLSSTASPGGDLLAIRVGRAETVSQGVIEHAVILIEEGKIAEIGEDLPIERGIPVLERPDWVVTPGLVSCFSRAGMDSRAGNLFEPQTKASGELYPHQDLYDDLIEYGVTTLGLYPPGTGVPGQAVAIKPRGDTREEMILKDGVYLTLYMATSARSKKMIRDAFEAVDKYEEKVRKAREKWEKEQEKKKKSKSKKDEDEKKQGESPSEFVAPEPEPKVEPFLELREKRLSAVISIQKSSDYLHLLDALGEEDIDFTLRVPLRDDIDLYEIEEKLGESGLTVIMSPTITLQPFSRRERNLPAELARAGAKVVLTPEYDRRKKQEDHEHWMTNVGELVARGLDRDVALASVTIEPARVLGLDERLGSLEVGKDANMVFWSGDPFEPASRIEAVMLEGEMVHGEVSR